MHGWLKFGKLEIEFGPKTGPRIKMFYTRSILIKQILFLDLAGGFGSLEEFEVSPVGSN